ncbi:MAG TPA: threonine/serine exporter [Firmicutes bacterium]|jgi:uncharacterized membrane protein YjjB (DUF3815 family)|nr:threonine/serine exporter [Bacillota bacterium]
MAVQMVMGFLAALTFGYIFRVPAGESIRCGLVGCLGWTIFLAAQGPVGEVGAVFLAATAVAVASEVLARRRHQPVIVFLTPGIIPIVPGSKAYLTMLSFVQKDYAEGLVLLVTTLFLAGAVAAGIIITSSIFRSHTSTKPVGR